MEYIDFWGFSNGKEQLNTILTEIQQTGRILIEFIGKGSLTIGCRKRNTFNWITPIFRVEWVLYSHFSWNQSSK